MVIAIQRFNKEKALEAIVYIASNSPYPTYHKISKVLYFADKIHLERYGCLLSEDTYRAMDNGPVPSHIYNMMKFAAGRSDVLVSDTFPEIKQAMHVEGRCTVKANRAPNLDYLSASEVECLDESIRLHGRKSFGQLTDESHDAAWESVGENELIPVQEIINTLPNAQEVAAYYVS